MKEFLILTDDNIHEYNVTIEFTNGNNVFSLYASNNDIWNEKVKNKLLLQLIDNGSNIKFNCNLKTIEYDKFAEMMILIKIRDLNKPNINKLKYKFYKKELAGTIWKN